MVKVHSSRLQVSLKSSFLILSLVAITLAGACEFYRSSLRAVQREQAMFQLNALRQKHELVTRELKERIAADPANAAKYTAKLEQADAELNDVELRMKQ